MEFEFGNGNRIKLGDCFICSKGGALRKYIEKILKELGLLSNNNMMKKKKEKNVAKQA